MSKNRIKWDDVKVPDVDLKYALQGQRYFNKSGSALKKVIDDLQKRQSSELSNQQVIDLLSGKKRTDRSIPDSPRKKFTTEQRAEKIAALRAQRAAKEGTGLGVEAKPIEEIPTIEPIAQNDHVDPIPEIPAASTDQPSVGSNEFGAIPDGFPDGSEALEDGTFRLPSGHVVRRISDEQAA